MLFWGIFGLIASRETSLSTVRLSLSALNILVGILIIVRRPARINASLFEMLLCVPSLLAAGWTFVLAPLPDQWPTSLAAVFCVAVAWTIVSFLCLGRNFAIFPSLREITIGGPYRLVRHPAYLGELIMVATCALASHSPWSAIPVSVATVSIGVRIVIEEKLLFRSPDYQQYVKRVGSRLIPGVW